MFHAADKRRRGRRRGPGIDPIKVLLSLALAAAVVLGASIWLGASAWVSRTPAPAPAPAGGADVQVHVSDRRAQETAGPQDAIPEVEAIATVVNESDNPEEAPEQPPEEPQEVKPLIAFSQEALDERIGAVVGSIITDGMTKREQAYAIFRYVNSHVRYVGTVQKDGWQEGAFEGLITGRGDCYTYYALSRALLTAVGIDNLEVRRLGGTDDHYWNLVNCGDGWYHFDAGPHAVPMPDGGSFFMFTDAQAAAYTEAAGRNYYDFDGSLYPERAADPETGTDVPAEPGMLPEEPFEEPQVPAEEPQDLAEEPEDPAEEEEIVPPESPEEGTAAFPEAGEADAGEEMAEPPAAADGETDDTSDMPDDTEMPGDTDTAVDTAVADGADGTDVPDGTEDASDI